MTASAPLAENASVTLDGAGAGTLRMMPQGGGQIWLPTSAAVKCSTAVNEATCRIYIGPSATDQYFIDGTFSGSSGDSTDRVAGTQVDTHGNTLWAVWAGGDAGVTATMTVTGTEQVP